jgi:hypothetical protein
LSHLWFLPKFWVGNLRFVMSSENASPARTETSLTISEVRLLTSVFLGSP